MQANTRKTEIPTSVWLGMLSIYIIWGSTYLAIRFAVETIPPFLMVGVRNFIAGVIMYAFMRLRGTPAPTRVNWRSAAVVGLLLLTGGNGLVSWAEKTVPSAVTALLVGAVPLWMVLLDWISGRYRDKSKRPSWLAFAGVLTGFGGIALLVGPGANERYAAEARANMDEDAFAAAWAAGQAMTMDQAIDDVFGAHVDAKL